MNKIQHIFLPLLLLLSMQLSAQEQSNSPYIEIESEVERKVIPDNIYLNLQVKATKSKSIDKIEQQVVSRLAKIGIAEDRIFLQDAKSDLINVWFKKKHIADQKKYQILAHSTHELSKCMEVLDMEGVENFHVSHTEYSQEEELKLEMYAEAVKKAKVKAKAMLLAIDEELGSPVIIRENRVFARQYATMKSNEILSADMEPAPKTPDISFRKQTYKIQVYVRFNIKPKQ